jgi:hypothetical protein
MMSSTSKASGRGIPLWPKDALRITFGVIWLIDATLKWLPGFRSDYMSMIMGAGQGQPGWLHWWFNPAVAFSVLIWATAEGFGGPYTSGSADIGTAVIYAVVFVGLLALMAYSGPARYSVDYYLEKKISWWWKVAEIRRPVQDVPAPAAPVITAEPATSTPAIIVPSPGQPSRPPARQPSQPFR